MNPTPASWAEARRIAYEHGLAHGGASESTAAESVPLENAIGRVLAGDVASLTAVPSFATAAMDGWAVSGSGPWLAGDPIAAGHPTEQTLRRGHARPISTGAVVPAGATAVLRSEDGRVDDALRVHSTGCAVAVGMHIRPAAEETGQGEIILRGGTRVTPPRAAVAAMAGYDRLSVARRPTIDLCILGDEIVGSGIAVVGTVRDALQPSLPAIVAMLGGIVATSRHVSDTRSATIDAVANGDAQITITTGGSSHGRTDFVRETLRELGGELLIDGIAMRPGSPTMLAALPNGRLLLALPGNPLAAVTALLSVGGPLIAGLLSAAMPPLATATLGVSAAGSLSRNTLMPCREEHGSLYPTDWQGSAMMRGLAEASAICIIPSGGALAGDSVQVLPLPWTTG